MSDNADDDVRVLLVHPVLWPQILEWLDSRGLTVAKMPPDNDDEELDTFTVTPKWWSKS